MRIGFGCTILSRGLNGAGVDGIGSYTRELGSKLLTKKDIALSPVIFRGTAGEKFPFPGPAYRYPQPFSSMAGIAALTKCPFPSPKTEGEIDIFHATDHLIPKLSHIPVIATLMDAIPLSHPEWVHTRLAKLKNWLWRQTAQWADHILTISEYSKHEIARCFGIPPEKISVIPLGVNRCYFERFSQEEKREIVTRYALPDRFFLALGTLQPRKNIEHILDAHAALPEQLQEEIPLVIVGRAGWGCDALVTRLEDKALSGHVRWLKYLPERDVRLLLQAATALVFPSLYEGFGLPVVEAFASGLPVIASNTTAFPEIAGDAALLVDPINPGHISEAMHQLAKSQSLVDSLTEAGLARARQLSWEACADRTVEVYRKVLQC